MKAVVLVSGGIDSTTCMAIAQHQKYEIHALTFDYSQRHKIEIDLIKKNIQNFNVKSHSIAHIDLSLLNRSSLINQKIDVNQYDSYSEVSTELPDTYVPARNLLFLSYALAVAENLEADAIFIGVHDEDGPSYPDCTIEFIKSFENIANVCTSYSKGSTINPKTKPISNIENINQVSKLQNQNKSISILAPLIQMKKAEIISKGIELGVDYKHTISCYNPNDSGRSCGKCRSCSLRLHAFKQNNIPDPIKYQE